MLQEKATELSYEIGRLAGMLCKAVTKEFEAMNLDELEALQGVLTVTRKMNEYLEAEAIAIDELNEKMDRILEKLDK